MNIQFWNIRGIANKASQQQLWYLCKKEKIDILGLSEPLIPSDSYKFCKLLSIHSAFENCNQKIWLFVNSNFTCEVLEDNVQFLHCKISSPSLPSPFLLSVVYANCSRLERLPVWSDLSTLNCSTLPWVLMGDYNIISAYSEKSGGSPPTWLLCVTLITGFLT